MKIYITEPFGHSDEAVNIYKSFGEIGESDILVVKLKYKIDEEFLSNYPNVKIIATSTTGLNHIDLDYCEKKGIRIASLKGQTEFLKDIPATAELTMGLILSLVRKIPQAFQHTKSGNWERDLFRGIQLKDKVIGILGYGRLGKMVAGYCREFNMEVLEEDLLAGDEAHSPLQRLLSYHLDFLTIHIPLDEKTKELVRYEDLVKFGGYLINTSRGEIIEKGALLKSLEGNNIKGAAIDVKWDEPDGDKELIEYANMNDNLLITPHIGGNTLESCEAAEIFLAQEVKKIIEQSN